VGLAVGRHEGTGAWKAALGASAVLAAGAGWLAPSAAASTALPIERASVTAVAILGPDGRDLDGTATLFVSSTPAATDGYRFPHDGSLLRIGHIESSATRGSGDAVEATGAVVMRSVELFGGSLQVDVLRARASVAAPDGTVVDGSGSHLVRVRRDGKPLKVVPGTKIWVKGWGYAVVDDPVARSDAAGGGDTLAGLRLHLTSAHSGLPAGTDILLGRVHADLAHLAPPPVSGQGSSGGSGGGGTLPDRQAKAPGKHGRRAQPAPGGRRRRQQPAKQHRHGPRLPAPVIHPVTPPLHAAHGSGARAAVVRAALAQVGWPYVWGGDSRTEGGFDCSGLIDHAYARAGYGLPGRPTADVLWAMSVPVRSANMKPGDLVFLGARSGYAHHVGLYAGDGWVIAAPHRGALVEIEPLAAVPWDGFGRILRAPRGRLLTLHRVTGSDHRPPRERHVVMTKAAIAVDPVPAAAVVPARRRRAPEPAPPRRPRRGERVAALTREEFRHWGISLLSSFRGAGR
jgi:cell wall-associated NlpC family hydrolase